MTDLNVFCSEVEGGARSKISNAWIYWREGSKELVLRADDRGVVLGFTSGDPKKPGSYKDPFVTKDGVDVKVAYNVGESQLTEDGISARLTEHTTKQSLSASLARLGPVKATPGAKTTVKVLPLAEIKLPKSHKFLRAVAATKFGGTADDVQAKNMDQFLGLNYGAPGGTKEFQGKEEKGFRDELRRVVAASGQQPINIIRDVKTAAEAVAKDDADERIVALVLHGNVDRIGRRLSGLFLVESALRDLQALKADTALARSRLKQARQRLEDAKKKGDPDEIDAAQEEVKSREKLLDGFDKDGLEMLDAFEAAGEALKAANVRTVELQACDAGGGPTAVTALGFLDKLKSLLTAKGHSLEIKGHKAALFSESFPKKVDVWVGSEKNKGAAGTQTSDKSLPIP